MTKTELKQKAIEWIAMQSEHKDEWYTSDKRTADLFLSAFLKEMFNINIDSEEK